MGMSTDMAPRYISVNPAGQMAYVLEASNLNLAQVQLAVPASEIVLIQDENKSINLCDNSVLVADVTAAENVSWLGNNVIVLVSQPQEYVMVEQEVVVDSNVAQSWQMDEATACAASSSVAQYVTKENCDEEYGELTEEETSATTAEDAKCWFRDSLITTAALSTLTTYVQSNSAAKIA